MKRTLKRAMMALGFDVVLLHSRQGKPIGMQIRSIRAKQDQLMSGWATSANIDGRQVNFFIANEKDEIQDAHSRGRFYEEEELRIIGRHFKGGVFVDVGSNVGNHALYAALVLGATRVLAFEPNPVAAMVLRTNIAINDLSDKIIQRQVGLSQRPGKATISAWPEYNMGAVRLAETAEGNLTLARGDDLLATEEVAFIKVDVEGMEIDALKGLRETIARDRPNMFVEVNPENTETFRSLMDEMGYRIADQYERYPTLVNYLVVPAEAQAAHAA